MKLKVPAVFAIDETRAENRIRLVAEPATTIEGTAARFARDRVEGFFFTDTGGTEILIIPKPKNLPVSVVRCLVGEIDTDAQNVDLSGARWLRHPILTATEGRPFDYPRNLDAIWVSWGDAFFYVRENAAGNVKGLRTPQIGAIHAIHSHWTSLVRTGNDSDAHRHRED